MRRLNIILTEPPTDRSANVWMQFLRLVLTIAAARAAPARIAVTRRRVAIARFDLTVVARVAVDTRAIHGVLTADNAVAVATRLTFTRS